MKVTAAANPVRTNPLNSTREIDRNVHPYALLPCLSGRLSELADRNDDAQPHVGAIVVALPAHLLHHLARLCRRFIAMTLDELMRCALNVDIRWGHGATLASAR